MAMAARAGEDEFGNLFVDSHVQDVHALRGFGSVHWLVEDEREISSETPARKVALFEHLPGATVGGCYASISPAQMELDASAIQCTSNKDDRAHSENHVTDGISDAKGIALHSETDSDDDLHIVLNPSQKVAAEGSAEDSEDGEDFVVLASSEVVRDQEWREDSFTPPDHGSQANLVGGEKLGTPTHEQVQSGKTSGVHSRIAYGGQAYHRHYKYVRTSGASRVGAISNGNAKEANCKIGTAKPDRIGGGRGVRRIGGGIGAARCVSSGPEYILPSNKTVFDIDIDAFKEKPWRLSSVNMSDYFNFGLDESKWKQYCKQLAQFCLEVTTQSKISVYEGGRIGQSTVCDIQAGGCGGGGWTSADVQGQHFRDSDAIFLIDGKEDKIPQSCSEGDVGDVCKVLDSGSLNKNVDLKNRAGVPEQEWPSVERRRGTNKKRSNVSLESLAEELPEKGSVAVVSRPKTPSPGTPPERLPTQGKRDMMVGRKSRSSSLNDCPQVGQEVCMSGALNKRKQNMQLAGYANSYGASNTNAALKLIRDEQLSRRMDLKRSSYHMIAAQITKKRRLNSHEANHGCHFASLLIRKFSRVHSSKTALETHVEAETMQKNNAVSPGSCPRPGFPLGGRVVRRKFSGVHSSKTAHVEAETLQQESHSSGKKTLELPNVQVAFRKFSNGASDDHVTESAERQANPIKVEKKSKKKVEADSTEVGDVLQDIRCHPIKEKSKKKLKVKKSKKACKSKERVKSKDKVHLPGCPCLKKGLVSSGRAPNISVDVLNPSDYIGCERSGVEENPGSLHNEQKEPYARKAKKSVKSKDKPHLPGSPHFEKGLVSGVQAPTVSIDTLNRKGNLGCERSGVQENPANLLNQHKLAHVHKAKKRVKSKIKVHLPGWQHLEKGLACGSQPPNMSLDTSNGSSYVGLEKGGAQENPTILVDEQENAYGHKVKETVESKDTVHLPGWPHSKQGLVCESQIQTLSACTLNGSGHRVSEKFGVQENNLLDEEVNLYLCKAKEKVKFKDEGHMPGCSDLKRLLKQVRGSQSPNASADALDVNGYIGSERDGGQEIPTDFLNEQERAFGCKAMERVKSNDNMHLPGCPQPKKGLVCDNQPPIACADTHNFGGYVGSERSGVQEITTNVPDEHENTCPAMSDSSEDEGKHRGRSKFERWQSHSEQYELDMPLRPSDTQNASRISLSKKLATTTLGQCSRQPDDSAVGLSMNVESSNSRPGAGLSMNVESSNSRPGAGRKWKVATRFAGRMKAAFNQQDHLRMSRRDEQQSAQQHLHQFVEKLEKRRERFNLTLEEIGPRKLANKDLTCAERLDARSGRPARKRCWGVADAVY